MKRYGPPRRRAQNASAALRIFVRHPKKTFATISATSRLMHCRILQSITICVTAATVELLVKKSCCNAAASALAVLARLRHFTCLRDAADLLPGRSHLKQLFSLLRVHPLRCQAPWVGMLDGLATHLKLERTTRKLGLAGVLLSIPSRRESSPSTRWSASNSTRTFSKGPELSCTRLAPRGSLLRGSRVADAC
jgi:hypothetical protein